MNEAQQVELASKVLSIDDGFKNPYASLWESIWWRVDGEYAPFTFWVNCNDLFYWACADCEKITLENFPMLLTAVNDVASALEVRDPQAMSREESMPLFSTGEWGRMYEAWGKVGPIAADLFCCRVRGMRPQRPYYPTVDDKLHPLFNACGPERDPKTEG